MTDDRQPNARVAPDPSLPRISVVIAAYNADQFLPRCLDNIRQQTYGNFELIVADGGSKDRTCAILQDSADVVDRWFSERDRGIYDAWNKALPFVTGQWVLFRGVDDFFWEPQSLERAARQLARAGEHHLIAYGRMVRLDERGVVVAVKGEEWPLARRKFFQVMTLPHPATFHRVKAFERFGGFDPSYSICGDYEFTLRVLKETDALFLSDGIVSGMQAGGVSQHRYWKVFREQQRVRKAHGLGPFAAAQCKHLLVCAASQARHAIARRLLGAEAAARLVSRRRDARARRVAERAGLPSASHPIYQEPAAPRMGAAS